MGKELRARIGVIAFLLGGVLLALTVRVVYLQSLCRVDARRRAARICRHREEIPPRRGEIRDRRGVLLAQDRPVHDLHCYITRPLAPGTWERHPLQEELDRRLPEIGRASCRERV
jgi:cell division protein FtsI/penicillin-binding protein 2